MQQAFQRVRELSDEEQDRLAEQLIRDLDEDAKWEATSIRHAEELRAIADSAWKDHEAGLTEELGPETL